MAQTAGLKKKGTAPARVPAVNVIDADPRQAEGRKVPIQVSVPQEVQAAFKREANERFDDRKGAMSDLFLELWHEYRRHKA